MEGKRNPSNGMCNKLCVCVCVAEGPWSCGSLTATGTIGSLSKSLCSCFLSAAAPPTFTPDSWSWSKFVLPQEEETLLGLFRDVVGVETSSGPPDVQSRGPM